MTTDLAVAQSHQVHPGIAPPASAQVLQFLQLYRRPTPMFQFPDGHWDCGEGFAPNDQDDADFGGWHTTDDGTGVEAADVHYYGDVDTGYPYAMWSGYPRSAPEMRRFVGFLRPPGEPLPSLHPLYGATGIDWVDDAAFEVFAPLASWNRQTPIVISIGNYATMVYPRKLVAGGEPKSFDFRTRYPGLYSPDGLPRAERSPGGLSGFLLNTDDDPVGRSSQTTDFMRSWAGSSTIYPIAAYIVPPVIQRPTELMLQRSMQLVQAIKLLLIDPVKSPFSPPLTQAELASVTVVFQGGSNGGNQTILATMLYPDIVHGGYGLTFGASLERVLGEQEMGWAISHLSGFAAAGSQLETTDMRNFAQFAWSHGLEIQDVSVLRRFALGQTLRPLCLFNGDEDITATGADWMQILSGGSTFQVAGEADALSTRSFAWMSGQKCGHYWRKVTDPYTGAPASAGVDLELIDKAISSRLAQPNLQRPTLQPFGRTAAEQMRGEDDPHEWWLGSQAAPAATWPPANAPLRYDGWFFDTVQPGAAGTWLGHRESLLIRNERIYVGGTEGVVRRFKVDWSSAREDLVCDAQSPQLGHEAWGTVFLDNDFLVVGTRRHLHLLQAADLTPLASVQLPWEQAKPHHLQLAEVSSAHSGKEIVFATVQGGLVAYACNTGGAQFTYLGEYSEPGVTDFLVNGTYLGRDVLTLLSERGIIASVAVDLAQSPVALLTSASMPQDGGPIDLEMANLFVGSPRQGLVAPAVVALYGSDDLGFSLRVFDPQYLQQYATVANISAPGGAGLRFGLQPVHHFWDSTQNGDHLLVLFSDSLILYNESAQVIGQKQLFSVPPQSGRIAGFTPGMHACAIAAGELGGGSSTEYPEEIVVATETGHLMWMHLSEVAGSQVTSMPSLYGMYTGSGSNVQPRTNQAMSCAWGIAAHPNEPAFVHLIDQDDNHWKVDHQGNLQLVSATTGIWPFASEVRGSGYLGVSGVSGAFQNYEVQLQSSALLARAWCPKSALGVLAQKDSPSAPANNWAQRDVSVFLLDGFGIFTKSGDVLANGNNRDCFWWSDPPLWDITPLPNTHLYDAWGNMAQGVHLTGGIADGVWASSTDSPQPPNGNQDFLDLRNIAPGFPSNDQQSVRVVVDGSERYLVFGCPGGRVRVVHAGAMNTGSAPHGIGYEASTSEDYGHGGCALAVVPDGTGIDIYFGVIVRNAVGVTYPSQPLQNSEVMTGRIVKLRFDYATDMLSPVPVWMHDLEPSSTDRGGYGVVGIHVDEIFPNAPATEEKEVVVTTMSGDVFVFAESGPLRFRASVPGAAGFYNSILALDLNGDSHKELYIAGSMGLHRFVSPSEQGVHP